MPPTVHRFTDSGEAYDASQCDPEIHDGDVLVVVSDTEKSVAILIGAWPVCIIPGYRPDVDTHFDCLPPGTTIEDSVRAYCGEDWVTTVPAFYAPSIDLARTELAGLGERCGA